MNAEQQAWIDWVQSKQGQSAGDAKTLHLPDGHAAQYLHNRLMNAFRAGVEAGERIAKDKIKARFSRVIDEICE